MNNKILHKELSYKITGFCFQVHNDLGRFCKEKQYADAFESLLKEDGVKYQREIDPCYVDENAIKGNRLDFLVEDKIVLEFKAKKMINKDDYYQIQRYLKSTGIELGMIVNFRNSYLKPKRILNGDV